MLEGSSPKADTIEKLQKLIEKEPNNAAYFVMLGHRYLDNNHWEQVAMCIEQAAKIGGQSIELLRLSVEFEVRKGDYASALFLAQEINYQLNNPTSIRTIIELYKKQNDFGNALICATQGVAQFPLDQALRLEQCSLLRLLGNIAECEACLKALIQMSPENNLFSFEYALFLREQGRLEEAKALLYKLQEQANLSTEMSLRIKDLLSEVKVETLSFKAQARLLVQLGEQMIENEIVALSELIKNAYDARSPEVKITVDTQYTEFGTQKGKIEIFDKGNGMTQFDVANKWLVLSTDHKEQLKRRKSQEWIPLGEKGIGRLSAHRLGQKLRLETTIKGESTKTIVEVDWDFFEYGSHLSLDNAKVLLTVAPEDSEVSYTRLIITNLRNPSFWNKVAGEQERLDTLKDEIFSLLTPFSSTLGKAFALEMIVNGRKLPIETIEEDFLEQISTAKVELTFYYDEHKNSWMTNTDVTLYPDFYFLKARKHIRNLETFETENNKWSRLYQERINLSPHEKLFPIKTNQDELIRSLSNLSDVKLLGFRTPGPFRMVIYSFSRDREILDRINDRLAEIYVNDPNKQVSKRKFFDRIKGIKIYRDGFRIFPYGEKGGDWLLLDQSASTYGTYDDIKSANTTGYVQLGAHNRLLREKTNREGFIEDAYSRTFFSICTYGVKNLNDILRRESNRLREAHDGVLAQANQDIQIKKEAEERARKEAEENIRKYLADTTLKPASEVASKASSYINLVKSEVKLVEASAEIAASKLSGLEEELEKVTELASFGMLVETFTHEFEHQLIKLQDETKTLKTLDLPVNGRRSVQNLSYTIQILEGYIKHLAPSYQKERKRRVRIELAALLKYTFGDGAGGFIKARAKRNNINIDVNIKGSSLVIMGNQGLLTQVLDNLYLNAEYWLNEWHRQGEIAVKHFIIELDANEKRLYIWDNGPGIDSRVRHTLFYAFETAKPMGEGRGLGLYIVKNILELLRIRIYLSDQLNKYGNAYKFVLDFTQNG